LLGTVTRQNWLGWDYPWAQETNVVAFRIYLAETNVVPYKFLPLGDLSDQRWPGTNSVSGLNGTYVMGVSALARLTYTNWVSFTNFVSTNLVTTNFTVVTNWIESDLTTGLVTFKDGIPVPPGPVQLYSFLQLAATNALPLPPFTGLAEYDLSGR
jgi:hypothetical protein